VVLRDGGQCMVCWWIDRKVDEKAVLRFSLVWCRAHAADDPRASDARTRVDGCRFLEGSCGHEMISKRRGSGNRGEARALHTRRTIPTRQGRPLHFSNSKRGERLSADEIVSRLVRERCAGLEVVREEH
jgi:hypothetical protein